MELHYGIKQPLRFYEKKEHQNRFRKGGYSRVFNLICPQSHLLPFQIRRPLSIYPIQSIKYVSTSDETEIEAINYLELNQIEQFAFDDYDYLVHFGSVPLNTVVPIGEYFLAISDGSNEWFSEVFIVRNFDTEDLTDGSCVVTKITYWDTCDVADIFYRTLEYGEEQYKNVIYLDIAIGKPEYSFTEEGEENGDGVFSPDFKRVEKQYLLQGVYPEFMVDALSLLPLHVGGKGFVEVLTSNGYTGNVDRLTVDPKWQGNDGSWALADIIFSTEFTVKTNCCDALDVPNNECLRGYVSVVARLLINTVDYNAFQYTLSSDGVTKIPLQENDLVLIELGTGELVIQEFIQGYVPNLDLYSKGAVILNENRRNNPISGSPTYYLRSQTAWVENPEITSESLNVASGLRLIQGHAHNGSLVELRGVGSYGDALITTATGNSYNLNGILYSIMPFTTGIYIRVRGLKCLIGESEVYTYTFGGVAVGSVGATFMVG